MNVKAISRYVGCALLVSALFMLLSILVSVSRGNDSALAALTISFTITFIVGIFPFIFVRRTSAITLKDGYMIIFLSWLLSFVFGMLPYVLWGGPFTVENAWFESVSGFTTTGATILSDVEALPDSLLFWRSSTHFIGGLGVVVFILLIIPSSSPIRMRLTNMELSSLSREGYQVRTNRTAIIFANIYIGLMIFAFFAYWIAGMSAFDAICHAFSVCATGGFSTKNLSIGAFDSRAVEAVTMTVMLLSSIHFGLLFLSFANRSLKPLNNPVLKFYLGALVFFTLYLAFGLRVTGLGAASFGRTVWDSAFQTLCVASTSGFATMDNAAWPMALNLELLFLGTVCGCAGSTSGGIKTDRIVVLFKSIGRQMNRILHPSTVSEVRLGNGFVKDEEASQMLLYIGMYALILVFSVGLVLMTGMDAEEAFASSISSLSNVGPSIKSVGTLGNFGAIPSAAKLVYTADMFLGRIEIYPILAVVAMIFHRNRK
ncbi:MAG: TrkH family potassium uptake protein [Bacteroidales bacterium]|nr:TrkH family potassium uptake protein [Bacteroidales bacterium]